MKKLFKRFLIFLSFILVIILVYAAYFMLFSNAPITQGEVEFSEEYKPGLKLDVYQPTKKVFEKSPVLVFFHGGAWITGTKETINANRFKQAFNQLRDSGYAIVSPNYTLARQGTPPFPNCINDAFDALYWIQMNSGKYKFDLQNVGLFGESAGGHIVLMTAYAEKSFEESKKINFKINYVVDVYGPTYLSELYEEPHIDSLNKLIDKLPEKIKNKVDITERLFGFDPEKDSTRTANYMNKYSPLNYINKKSPPTLIIHGVSDRLVPVSQSEILKQKLDSLGVEVYIHKLKDVDHALLGIDDKQKSDVQKWIINFIQNHTH